MTTYKTRDGATYERYEKFTIKSIATLTWIPLLIGENRVRYFESSQLVEVKSPFDSGMVYCYPAEPQNFDSGILYDKPSPAVVIEISVSQGYTALVEEVDKDLANLKWYPYFKHPYPEKKVSGIQYKTGVNGKGKPTIMHRVIMERILRRPLLRHELVDHKDRNPLNNQRSNLRLANRAQNAANSGLNKNNTSGFKGVSWSKVVGKWTARINSNYKAIVLGYFDTPEEAFEAYKRAAAELFGEFANAEKVEAPLYYTVPLPPGFVLEVEMPIDMLDAINHVGHVEVIEVLPHRNPAPVISLWSKWFEVAA